MTEVNDQWIPQTDRFSPRNLSMKRPTRPFVVEVKKKRGSPANRRSIWGDMDLSAVAADPLAVSEGILEPAGNDRHPDPVVDVDRADKTDSAIETASNDGDAHVIADATHAEPHPTEVEMEDAEKPARSSRKRVRRRDEPALPRGQRWKRRLPKALRR